MFVYLQTCVAFSTHFCIWYTIHVFDKSHTSLEFATSNPDSFPPKQAIFGEFF